MAKIYLMDRETLFQIGEELWRLRRERHLRVSQISKQLCIPEKEIEALEMGRHIQYGYMRKLAQFYGKKLRVTLE